MKHTCSYNNGTVRELFKGKKNKSIVRNCGCGNLGSQFIFDCEMRSDSFVCDPLSVTCFVASPLTETSVSDLWSGNGFFSRDDRGSEIGSGVSETSSCPVSEIDFVYDTLWIVAFVFSLGDLSPSNGF